MVVKGLIKELPQTGDNIWQVRIPYLEDNTKKEMVIGATLCVAPGVYGGYSVGDCVFVAFENDLLSKPVIIGKLFVEYDYETPSFIVANALKVTQNAEVPDSTTIGGYGKSNFLSFENGAGGGGGGSAVHYTEDTGKTAEEKAIARKNIEAISAVGSTPGSPSTINADTLENHPASYFEKAIKSGTIGVSTTWTGADPYTQTVTVTGATITSNSKIDIQPTAEQLSSFIALGVNALLVENNNETLTLKFLGAHPTTAMTLQVTVTEVA